MTTDVDDAGAPIPSTDGAGAPITRREQMKADRRRQLLDAAARLIAERGFVGVRLEDLGSAVGISGPAVYRHFPNKDAVLVELLVGISTRLFEGGSLVVAEATSPRTPSRVSSTSTWTSRSGNPTSFASRIETWRACLPTPAGRSGRRSGATWRSG